MKEAFVKEDLSVQILDTPIPELTSPFHILIKVHVTGTNPKDWKTIKRYTPQLEAHGGANTGDDIAGVVEKVGSSVYEFKPGDRVAAFHEMITSSGSFAEYAIAYQHCTFHIPPTTSFEEAATIPLAAMTAAIGLYRSLSLPQPWSPPNPSGSPSPLPLIIYGASSAVGFYALQFAIKSNIHPLICVAGRAGNDYILPYLDKSKGDVLIDYRDGEEKVVEALKNAAPTSQDGKKLPILHAFDAVSEHGSPAQIAKVFAANKSTSSETPKPKVTFVLGGDKEGIPDDGSVEHSITMVGNAHRQDEAKEFAHVYYRYISLGLAEGWFKPHRVEVVPGGLGGVKTALENLRDGKASGVKYVMRIGETEGVELK
ncbi:GroES (chaperonin 10)-like protein [Naviculisporaceae sp. PSN 640]